jgi:D-glycero-D-manno-heptose 1,7-bisphosphate phosphatase
MNKIHKAVFLDRDGVLNNEIGDYVCRLEDFVVSPGVPEALARLKAAGYYLIVVTNQAGIAKNLYDHAHVAACHYVLQEASGHLLDALYYASNHHSVSESIFRKPDSGMLEKAIARFNLDVAQCWIVGDRLRDMQAGERVGVRGILVGHEETAEFGIRAADLQGAADIILGEA